MCIYSHSVIVHGTNTVTWVSHFLLQNVKDYKPGDIKRPLLREMLIWMIKETELKPGGAERPLLREMLVWMILEKELKPGGTEKLGIKVIQTLCVPAFFLRRHMNWNAMHANVFPLLHL